MAAEQYQEIVVNQNSNFRIVQQDQGFKGTRTTLMEVNGTTGQVTITGLTLSGDMTLTGDITVDDLVVGDDLTVTGDAAIAGSVGFYGKTPIAQVTAGANLTNSVTTGGVNNTIGDVVAAAGEATASDLTTTRNAIFQLARSVKIIQDGLRAYGLLS